MDEKNDKDLDDELDFLTKAKERFEYCIGELSEERQQMRDDMDFYAGNQWDPIATAARQALDRPTLTFNTLPTRVRQVLNNARQNAPSIKVVPQKDGDVQIANMRQGIIKAIEKQSDSKLATMTSLEHAVIGGMGYFRVVADYSGDEDFDIDLFIKRISDPLTVVRDPDADALSPETWRDCFIVEAISKEEFEERFGEDKSASSFGDAALEIDGVEDIAIAEYWVKEWTDKTIVKLADGNVLDSEIYEANKTLLPPVVKTKTYKKQSVTQYILSGDEILEKNEWMGKNIPIMCVVGEEVITNGKKRYRGMVFNTRDAQRMLNFWRSSSVEVIQKSLNAPYIGEEGAFDADDRWETIDRDRHSTLEYSKGSPPPARQTFQGLQQSVLAEASASVEDIKHITGVYDAAVGASGNETSGVAINARDRQSDIGTFHYIDNLHRALRYCGQVLLEAIPYCYEEGRQTQIIGEDDGIKNMQIPQGFGKGQYSCTVITGPSYATQRSETAASMLDFMRAYPAAAPLMGDMIVKNLDWEGADQLSNRLKTQLPPTVLLADTQNLPGDIPPEYAAIIGGLQNQIQQATQTIEALTAQVQEKNTETAIQIKELEARVFEAQSRIEAAKIQAEATIAKTQIDTQSERDNALIKQQTTMLEKRFDAMMDSLKATSTQAKKVLIRAPSGQVYEGSIAMDQPEQIITQ